MLLFVNLAENGTVIRPLGVDLGGIDTQDSRIAMKLAIDRMGNRPGAKAPRKSARTKRVFRKGLSMIRAISAYVS